MRKQQWVASIEKGRLLRKRDLVGDLLGLYLVSGFWVALVFPTLQKDVVVGSKIGWLCVAVSLPAYAIYCLQQEDALTLVETKLNLRENRNLIVSAFHELGWDVRTNTKYVVTAGANNKWWTIGQTATALLDDQAVYLNVIHGGTSKGRLPFYFGSNQRKLNRLIATIQALQSTSEN